MPQQLTLACAARDGAVVLVGCLPFALRVVDRATWAPFFVATAISSACFLLATASALGCRFAGDARRLILGRIGPRAWASCSARTNAEVPRQPKRLVDATMENGATRMRGVAADLGLRGVCLYDCLLYRCIASLVGSLAWQSRIVGLPPTSVGLNYTRSGARTVGARLLAKRCKACLIGHGRYLLSG